MRVPGPTARFLQLWLRNFRVYLTEPYKINNQNFLSIESKSWHIHALLNGNLITIYNGSSLLSRIFTLFSFLFSEEVLILKLVL